MNLKFDLFKDVHLHAASVREWNQTYSQITPGSLHSSLTQLHCPRFQLFREQIDQRIVQHGEAPRGRMCFAIPLAIPGAARMQGREADQRSVFFLRGGEEFMFHMPTGMDLLSITFDREAFEQAVEGTPWSGELTRLLRQPVVQVPERRLAQSRSRLIAMMARVQDGSGYVDSEQAEQELERDLLEELLCLFADPECDKSQRAASSPASYIVEKCHLLTLDDQANPLSVAALCERLRISRRTVQNSFRAVTQTTPVNYIRCIRLNGVRRELLGTRPGELSIGDAASRWGFFHLSHFAADYQALFGELPSQTRLAGASTGGSRAFAEAA